MAGSNSASGVMPNQAMMVPNPNVTVGPLNTEPQFVAGAGVAPMAGQPTGNAAGAMGAKGGAEVAQPSAGVAPDPATLAGNTGKSVGGIPGFSGVAVPVAGSATLGGVSTTAQPGSGAVTTDPTMNFTGGSATFDETGGAAPSGSNAGGLFNNLLGTVQTTTAGIDTGSSQPAPTPPQTAAEAIAAAQGLPGLSSTALTQSALGAARAADFQPTNVASTDVAGQGYTAVSAAPQTADIERYTATTGQSQGYDAATAAAERAAAEKAASQGYTASEIAGVGPVTAERIAGVAPITAERATAGQIAQTDLSQYTNPFEAQVVQQSLSDLERARQMQQNVQGAQAQAAGAFGGSRQAIAEAETNRAFAEQAARTAAGLRQAGFTQAQRAAQADIASRMQADLANQRAALQAGTTTAQLGQQAQMANQRAGLQAATTTAQLGQQAQLANQAALNQASQFGAQAANRAALQNAQLATQAAMQNAQLGTQAALANQRAQNQAAQFGAQAANEMAARNMAAQNAAAQFGAQAANQMANANAARAQQASLANAAAANQAAQFGAQAGNTAALANQSAALQASLANQSAAQNAANTRLAASGQLGDISSQAFDTAGAINQQVAAQGAIEQAAQQALLDLANQQQQGFIDSPQQALQTQLGAFAGSQTGAQTQTQSRQPGLFDYLTLGASIL